MRTTSPRFRAMSRQPSYLISCNQSPPLGAFEAAVQSCGSRLAGIVEGRSVAAGMNRKNYRACTA
jgi:hypothetical protein